MGPIYYRIRRNHNFCMTRLVILFSLAFLFGCGSETENRVVDFSKTVVVDQPGRQQPENPYLKVAVAAMISPKDTFVYYRQLLDYIGLNLGRDVQFIQRAQTEAVLSDPRRRLPRQGRSPEPRTRPKGPLAHPLGELERQQGLRE